MAVNVPLTDDQITRVLDVIGMKESSSVPGGPENTTIGRSAKDGAIKKGYQNYGVINSINYVGKYQLGYVALVEVEYVKRGPTKNSALHVAENWLGTDGCSSLDDFLKNPKAQENAARKLFKVNYNYIRKDVSDCTAPEVAGYCAAAWLVGQGGARALRKGIDKVDANGTCASYYYKMGETACLGAVPEIVTPPAGKDTSGPPPEIKKDEEQKVTDFTSVSPAPPTSIPQNKQIETERTDTPKLPPEVAKKYADTGFMDPNLAFPRSNYKKLPDTNKLATGRGISDTVVSTKNKNRHQRIPTASGNEWEEPESPYGAQYPYNKVTETVSGHIMEVDDTPGYERLHQYHRSGTYTEINNAGSQVRRIVGDSYEIIDRNGNIFINGRCNLTVGGPAHILVLADANLVVKGNTNITSENDVNWEVSGNMNLMVNETFNVRSKHLNIEVDETRNTYVGQTSNEQVYGHVVECFDAGVDTRVKGIHNHEVTIDMNVNVGNAMTTKVVTTKDVRVGTDCTSMYGGKKTEKVAGDFIVSAATVQAKSSGKIDLKAGGNLNMDGSQVHINSGSASPGDAPESKDLQLLEQPVVTHTNLRYATKRSAFMDTSGPNMAYESRLDIVNQSMAETHILESSTGGGAVPESTPESTITQPTTGKTAATESTSVAASSNTVPTPAPSDPVSGTKIDPDQFLTMTDFPDSLKISTYFTLGQLLCGNKLSDTAQATKGVIVYNLSVLAQTVLDKIKYKYGNMKINSAYRTTATGAGLKSQHNWGQACDFKLLNVPLKEYEECAKWISENCPIDQIILEANKSSKQSLWIHVSVKTKYHKAGNPGKFTGYNEGTSASKTTVLPGIDITKLSWLDLDTVRTA